ncbi:DUF4185 domain-containing protein [Mycolicibacterium neoaurum]|uniref:DUF4185 domain-containing protein n=1 Tax=Mycolicibacterium neoaurum TaxID=1795 RepID=UPI00248B0874|nr:DUF4185 domain-containing protein [Mycolicibacterium neoaurum]WBP95316.1 DUF4185 domain-containing protein [Mycolicibacterium neoaurum]WBS08386.1 DUF4185 domain-containing protein [Mycolicibacterium neoaurum]
MGSSTFFWRGGGLAVGRVGGLAVALGVGTAIVSGHGIAAAEGSDSGGAGSSSNASNSTGGSATTSTHAGGATGSGEKSGDSEGSGSGGLTTRDRDTDRENEKDATSGGSGSEAVKGSGDDVIDDSKIDDSTTDDDEPLGGGSNSSGSNSGGSKDESPTSESGSTPPDELEPTEQTAPRTPRVTIGQSDRPHAIAPTTEQPSASVESGAGTTDDSRTTTETASLSTTRVADASDTLATAGNVAVFASARTLATATVTDNPSRPAATASAHPLTGVVKVVANVLDWAAGVVPGSPSAPTLAWALLAFARREVDNLLSRLDPAHAAATAAANSAAAATDNAARALAAAAINPRPGFPPPGYQFSPSTSFVDWVTGNFAPNDTFNRYGIWGTDIGTMWDNGIPDDPTTPINENQVLIAFGDTFGGPNMTGTWRLNTLFRSPDRNLADGLAVPGGQWFNGNMFGGSPLWEEHYARQIILPERLPKGLPSGVTLIPTAGISVPTPGTKYGATQYLSFMSVKQWGAAGQWSTNYSAIAYSEDNGENWYIAPSSVRTNFGGNANFQQGAFVRPGDGFVYSYGTPNGRQGQAFVSRVAEKDILDVTKYEYYSAGSSGWLFGIGAYSSGWYRNDPGKASPVFGRETGACGVAKAGNQVSEMSVQYNKTLGKYVAMHGDQFNNIILRTSDRPEGGWSAPTVVMGQQGGGIYAPMMHPWSPSTLGTGTELYFNLSVWNDYNVWLVKTDLAKL